MPTKANAGSTVTWSKTAVNGQNNKLLKTSALEDGQSIAGTLLAIRESSKFPGSFILAMRGLNGDTFDVATSGNLKYVIRDGKLEVGRTYNITKAGTKLIKGRASAQFNVFTAENEPAAANDEI